MVFAGYSGFLHYLQLASHELATIGINVTKNKIQKQTKKKDNEINQNAYFALFNCSSGQFARKEALLRIQAEDAKKEAEKEDEQPIITHEDTWVGFSTGARLLVPRNWHSLMCSQSSVV